MLSAVASGIKSDGSKDLVLIELAPSTVTAGVYTTNAFCAAPVSVTKQHLRSCEAKYLLINSGNANCGMGEIGMDDAFGSCQAVAASTGVRAEEVLPFSTGVIGERLPVAKIQTAIPSLLENLRPTGWSDAALGIMTTDTRPKIGSIEIEIDNGPVTIMGMAKGSGMIRPDMATLLVFLATDAGVRSAMLTELLVAANEISFNRITIDGDTSTNDCCMLSATNQSGVTINQSSKDIFLGALKQLCRELAQGIVKDGEGASKFLAVVVEGGKDSAECLRVAYSVAESPLVKTALFASDANWGRFLMAVGKSGVKDLDVCRIDIFLDDVCIVRNGERDADYSEESGSEVMARDELEVTIKLGRGGVRETVWTADLSHDYVRINAEYRT